MFELSCVVTGLEEVEVVVTQGVSVEGETVFVEVARVVEVITEIEVPPDFGESELLFPATWSERPPGPAHYQAADIGRSWS